MDILLKTFICKTPVYETPLNKIGYPLLLAAIMICTRLGLFVQPAPAAKEYFTVENYIEPNGGFTDEFIDLWKANHYPLLEKAMEKGDIISVTISKPKLHSGEDTR
ncbi:MAG TPA: hypothetical protein VMT76_02760 [Puia sp.]|nr:hypothetical protein [Puia sp.]